MCSVCWSRLRGDLHSVAELAEDLDIALARDVHFGGGGIGIVVRSADNPLPPDLHSGEVARDLRHLLGSWVRDLWETHAVRFQQCGGCGASWYSGHRRHRDVGCTGTWSEVIDPLMVADTLPELAGWLLRHPSWITNHVAPFELFDELTTAIDQAWLSVDRPADRVFLGICSEPDDDGVRCELDLYAKPGRRIAVCRCSAEHDIEERRGVLLESAGDQLLTATDVSRALPGLLGKAITAAQVRGYAHRGRLVQYEPHECDVRQAPRYRVRDVTKLLADMACEERAPIVA